jgi:hypothetical protein
VTISYNLVALVIAVLCGVALIACAIADWRWSGDVRLGIAGGGIIAAAIA